MKSQRYRMSNDKVWKQIRQIHDPSRYYKKGLKYDYILPSGYYVSQTYGSLHKCWLGFVIAKEKEEWDKIDLYAIPISICFLIINFSKQIVSHIQIESFCSKI
jgi:hypothetical protein